MVRLNTFKTIRKSDSLAVKLMKGAVRVFETFFCSTLCMRIIGPHICASQAAWVGASSRLTSAYLQETKADHCLACHLFLFYYVAIVNLHCTLRSSSVTYRASAHIVHFWLRTKKTNIVQTCVCALATIVSVHVWVLNKIRVLLNFSNIADMHNLN